jgi:hypothetical protein
MTGDQLSLAVAACSDQADAARIHVMAYDQTGGWRKARDFGFEWGVPF